MHIATSCLALTRRTAVVSRSVLGLGRARSLLQQRGIHLTGVVYKKKSKAVIDDDLFADDLFAQQEDLFKASSSDGKAAGVVNPSSASATPPPAPASAEAAPPKKSNKRHKLPASQRAQRFNAQMDYMTSHLTSPADATAHIRKRSLLTLLDLATGEEEVRRIVDLIPKLGAVGVKPGSGFGEAFVRRCQELRCAPLALEIFGNFSKYQIPLTQPGAQWLVHSFYTTQPLEDLMLVLALLPAYNLSPITSDLPIASMVVAACYKDGSEKAVALAESLRPYIGGVLRKTNIARAVDGEGARRNRWIAWSLYKVNRMVRRRTGKTFVAPRFIPEGFKIKIVKPVEGKENRATV